MWPFISLMWLVPKKNYTEILKYATTGIELNKISKHNLEFEKNFLMAREIDETEWIILEQVYSFSYWSCSSKLNIY